MQMSCRPTGERNAKTDGLLFRSILFPQNVCRGTCGIEKEKSGLSPLILQAKAYEQGER